MKQTQLILGLPKAGKTTFLAALWYVVETSRIPGSLQLVELPENRKHLIEIRERWVNCLEQVHTTASSEKMISLKLLDVSTQRVTELVVPDLSGESFDLQWSHRQCTTTYFELASQATGLLVFINPETIDDAPTIAEVAALGSVLGDSSLQNQIAATPSSFEAQRPATSVTTPWDSTYAPSQVKLVENLQFLTLPPFRVRPLRTVVVVSAWDRAKSEGISPTAWLERRMPLLDQFLRANREIFQLEVFGVSASGGRMQTDVERASGAPDPDIERLQSHLNAEDRIEVVGTAANTHDITAIVRSAMT